MFGTKLIAVFIISATLLAACFGPPPQGGYPPGPQGQPPATQGGVQPSQVNPTISRGSSSSVDSSMPHSSAVDLAHLNLGDGKYSAGPQVGYVYSCQTSFNQTGGAGSLGSWLNGDGTWDLTKKLIVEGSVTWPHSFMTSLQGDQRVFQGNDLPDHATGNFPISSGDDAYSVDRNPNSIKAQTVTLTLPANPIAAAQANCVGGEVGIMLSGVVIFSAFDAEGRDAPAHEAQDNCNGHPQNTGFYHYHNLTNCIQDNATGHSALMGYAFDGFGIYGFYGEDGKELTNADLDPCHGHTHVIEWNGQKVEMYHYHATHEFPYVVGCFHGNPAVRALSAPGGGGQGGQPQQGGQNGNQPPQEAITACSGLTQGASCSVNTPNGTISGQCQTPPDLNQLVCVPAGGPPKP